MIEDTVAPASRAPSRAEPLRYDPPGPGSWKLDAEHCERPHCRYMAAPLPEIYAAGFRRGMERYGAMLETIDCAVVHGFTYLCPRPIGAPPDAKGTPPKLVFKLLTWLHPAVRRRTRRAAAVLEQKPWREDVVRFFGETWPQSIARFERDQAIDLEALDDAALLAHLEGSYEAMCRQLIEHFAEGPAGMVPIGDLIVHATQWTGCSREDVLALLDGSSPWSVEVMKELDAVTDALRSDADARLVLDQAAEGRADAERVLATLRAHPRVGAAVERWLDRVGQRILTGYDLAELRGLEVPEVLVTTLRTAVARPPRELDRARVERAAAALRSRVPEAHRATFDALLDDARRAYPLRDGHSVIDFWCFGLVRRGLLEAGRRLAARGALAAADHAVDLEHAELVALLRGAAGPSAAEVAARVASRLSRTMEDAPEVLGPPPSAPPPPEWLPAPAARIARALAVYIDSLNGGERRADARAAARPAPAVTTVVSGIGASPGRYVGRARLVTDPSQFSKVERGDVLVARITTPSYNVLLPLLGAVVTDRGGVLSHPAIVAREYGIPGVVGCRDATARIEDGMQVEVDGAAGTVKVLA